ncbi:uncharacterized protein LOC115172696 isoform X1 [Salmo trutta]|uniref:uncharacterized protein LOC115172696 isoform X1 n=1 Tax=Salmo trutta TaxID=8032 RepID=UPI001130FEAB|nr:interferon alpha-inducible protein 27, mitochondrial isoform X1 [Salmo trutta]XP_029586249.1 interferon alpha-inducible protein 27, mitochondrial isoform X1 [Salmo trutta]XP_029586250.1 interferon alpha-inducible protein 27, mitochondrial isoform X1 [Salmo trutta]
MVSVSVIAMAVGTGLFGPDRYGSSVHGPFCFGSDGVRCWWGCSWINRSRHDVFCSCGQWRWGSSRESCCCSTVSRSCRTHQCGHSGCGKCRRGSRWSGGMGVL